MVRLLKTLLIPPLFAAGQGNNFQCGVPELAEEMTVDQAFDSVKLEGGSCSWQHGDFLVPETVHWHVYATEDGAIPKISMLPEGLVEPYVSGGALQFRVNETALQGVSQGDKIEAAVNVYIPVSQMKTVQISGVDQVVEIINYNSTALLEPGLMKVQDSGVDNRMYVAAPNTVVHYRGSGVDTLLQVDAAAGSSIDISGVDQTVRIKSEDVDIKMTGVDQRVHVQGSYDSAKMTGVDGNIYVNGANGCAPSIDNSGVDNKCSSTEEIVSVQPLKCLADTKAVQCQAWRCNFISGAGAAAGIGIVIFVVVLSVVLCCCCGCCGSKRTFRKAPAVLPSKNIDEVNKSTPEPSVASTLPVEAEVIKVEVDPEVAASVEKAPTTTTAKVF